jgi:hypothetical protein
LAAKKNCAIYSHPASTTRRLMRVYGALMWSLGKIVQTPEVVRVYVSSFWENAKTEHLFLPLFDKERQELLKDLRGLPKASTLNKVNELVKRCRLLKVHMCIISTLKEQMPSFMGKQKKSTELIDNLDKIFVEVQRKYKLAVGDFPNLEAFREKLSTFDMSKFKKIQPEKLGRLETVLGVEIPALIHTMSQMEEGKSANPFSDAEDGLLNVHDPSSDWAVAPAMQQKAMDVFQALDLNLQGRATGSAVRQHLEKTGLDLKTLRQIWNLSSLDGQGSLDKDEFTVAMYLVELVANGKALPSALPLPLVPPSKRASPLLASK